ncbi:hypothetical protein MYU51_005263 [Penicillium brevicompactum]
MSNHQYESVSATPHPSTDISSRWKVAAVLFPAAQLVGYMMLAIVIGDTSHELRFDRKATIISAILIIASSLLALVWIACAKWQQRDLLLHLFITYLVVNLLALIDILLHINGNNAPMRGLQITGLCLPIAVSVTCALAAIIRYWEARQSSSKALSEEEMQRRQLKRLLKTRSSVPSPELIRNTYRFDLPETQNGWSPLVH